ncbi:chorismate mutase [candidate division KSB1 bacterium]|nr:chorismate mutase [candidate division KSB1 bacterium]
MELENLREAINEIDRELVVLLNKRADLALRIGKIKLLHRMPIHDMARELIVLENITSANNGPLKDLQLRTIFKTIMSSCREVQNHLGEQYDYRNEE